MPRILIVDDDSQFRRTLRLALALFGYDALESSSGRAALANSEARELIILDRHMGGMDGIQTCRALRAKSSVPIIMISGDRSTTKADAIKAGANSYLPKPFSINDLVALIESCLTDSNVSSGIN
ncbi:MAG TPA: response regulator transcription factor [Bryobacteraceae bacterium]|jgi:DNA-binding response OmpR family regulator